eukprot:3736193-Prymnesium_polylepis.1
MRSTNCHSCIPLDGQRQRRVACPALTENGHWPSAHAKNGVLALPLDEVLCVAPCSAYATRSPDMMLKRHDALQLVG